MADIKQNINYNYKTNVQTLTRYHDRFNASLGKVERTTQRLQRAIGTKDAYALRSEKITYRNAQATNKLRGSIGGLGKGMGGLALRFVGYQMILNQVMGLQQKFIQLIQDSVKAFREFELRMAEVSTILGAEQLPLMDRLSHGVEQLSMTYGQATSDMAKGLYDILSAAFDAEVAINLLTTATKASIAGLSDIRTSVDIFTTVLNTYGMQVEQATDVSNILFQSVIRGKFQFQDLEQALGYVVPIAAQAGIQFEELMGALSTATRHGLHLDMTARGLALAIQGIVNPSVKATKAAEKYGIEMNGLALRVMGLYGWFKQLNEATKEYGKSILGELIPNMRSLRVAMVLAGDVGLEGFNKDLQELAKMGNATEIALKKIMQTSQFVSNQLTQQWEKVKREVGNEWDEMMLNFQRGIIAIVGGIDRLLGGKTYISRLGEKYQFISDNDLANAVTYLQIADDIFKLEESRKDISWDLNWIQTAAVALDKIMGVRIPFIHPGESPYDKLDKDLGNLVVTQQEFVDSFNKVTGGILDEVDVLGDLELTLSSVELSIRELDEELTKTFVYGFKDATGIMKEASININELTTLTQEERNSLRELGSTIQGNLAYQYMSLTAQRAYADATHDVTSGLKISNYVYKEIPYNIRLAVDAVREYTKAQDDNRKATQQMTAAMRTYQIQLLQLQLKGMMRRRGLTRNEQKQIKAIQIAQAQARLENMQGQKKMLEADVSTYQDKKEIIDDYLFKLKEEQYELKYTYDQQIADLEATINREGEKLQARYRWWEDTNQKIIDNSEDLIDTLDTLMEEPLFIDMLDEYGIKVDELRSKIASLMATAGGRVGTYGEPTPPTPELTKAEREAELIIRTMPPTPSEIWDIISGELRYGKRAGTAGPDADVSLARAIPEYQHGISYVPETQLAMVHQGETIIPEGKQISTSIVIENLTIDVKEIAELDDIEKLGALLSSAQNAKLLTRKGQTRYRIR